MNKKYKKIGVFDSGMGGLTVLSEIEKLLPYEDIIYYADAGNCPYGDKTKAEILGYTRESIQKLINLGSKLIVVACNTATNSAIKVLREEFSAINFVAMEPAVKPATELTKTGNIAVIATQSTINGESLGKLCDKYAEKANIFTLATPELVKIVENNEENSEKSIKTLSSYFSNILEKNIDTIVLGCTHYAFLKNDMLSILKEQDITVIDAAYAVAKQTAKVLNVHNLTNNLQKKGTIEFYSSSSEEYNNILKEKYENYTKSWRK